MTRIGVSLENEYGQKLQMYNPSAFPALKIVLAKLNKSANLSTVEYFFTIDQLKKYEKKSGNIKYWYISISKRHFVSYYAIIWVWIYGSTYSIIRRICC